MICRQTAVDFFASQFGGEPETKQTSSQFAVAHSPPLRGEGLDVVVTRAPGRVNLIGEHTDYNEGLVFPAAIDRYVWIAARRTVGESRWISRELGEGDWRRYTDGVESALCDQGLSPCPVEAVVLSDVPVASGVSSSAALELAACVLWNALGDFGLAPMEMAKIAQQAENTYVRVACGLMDQMASACGRAGHAMLFDVRSGEIDHVPMPPKLAIVLCDTLKPRALAASKYNERRSECETACRNLAIPSLREATLGMLGPFAAHETWVRRARHVITEIQRCEDFVGALRRGDQKAIGELMRRSHASLRDDYEVSCFELDSMAEAAWQSPGCVGARMTGAGFGGACVALVDAHQTAEFIEGTQERFERATGVRGTFMVCLAADGAASLRSGCAD